MSAATPPPVQLCATWTGKRRRYPVLVQPKIDGLRCVIGPFGPAGELVALTRNGYRMRGCSHILAALTAAGVRDVVLDGELFSGAWGYTIADGLEGHTPGRARFHAFDCVPLADWRREWCRIPYRARIETLRTTLAGVPHCLAVITHEALTTAGVESLGRRYLDLGYEGAVIKDPEAPYAFGSRGKGWYKLKPVLTTDCLIIDVQTTHPFAVAVRTPRGHEQAVWHFCGGPEAFFAELAALALERAVDGRPSLAGVMLEVEHGGERLGGVLVAPRVKRIRYDRLPRSEDVAA